MNRPSSRTVRQALAVAAMTALVAYLVFFFTPPEVARTGDTGGSQTTATVEPSSPGEAPGAGSATTDGSVSAQPDTAPQTTTSTGSDGSGPGFDGCGIDRSRLPDRTVEKLQGTSGGTTNLYATQVSDLGRLTSQVVFLHGTEVDSGVTDGENAAVLVGCGATINGDVDVDTVVLKHSVVNGDLTARDVTVFGDDVTTVDGDVAVAVQFTAFGPVEAGGSVTCGSGTVAGSGRLSADGSNDCT